MMIPEIVKSRSTGIPHQRILLKHSGAFLIGFRYFFTKTIGEFPLIFVVWRIGSEQIALRIVIAEADT